MKENSTFSKLTLEQLQKRSKIFTTIVIILCIITVVSLAVFAYYIFSNQDRSSIPLGFFGGILALSSVYLIKIETEIKSRNS